MPPISQNESTAYRRSKRKVVTRRSPARGVPGAAVCDTAAISLTSSKCPGMFVDYTLTRCNPFRQDGHAMVRISFALPLQMRGCVAPRAGDCIIRSVIMTNTEAVDGGESSEVPVLRGEGDGEGD